MRRSIGRVIAGLVFMLTVAWQPCHAGQSAHELFQPLVTHQQFTLLSQQLNLDRQQRMIAELVFNDYTDSIAALASEADREADEAGRQTILQAVTGQRYVAPNELRQLRLAVLDIYRRYLPQVDQQLDDMLDGVRILLQSEQREAAGGAMRQLRRSCLLQPREAERNSFAYAGDGVDVLVLLERARRDDGELAALRDDALANIVSAYETQLDALLSETSADYRDAQMQMRIARVRQDRQAMRNAEAAAMRLWQQLYDLNDRTVRMVGDVALARLGEDTQEAWRQRFIEACFPWMISRGLPDRQYEWLAPQQLTAEQRAEADRVYETFQVERRELRDAAIALMLTARKEMQSVIYAMMQRVDITNPVAQSIHTQLLHNSGELASAEARAAAGFESLLSDSQRAAMRRAMRR